MTTSTEAFTTRPDLACRTLGGSVVAANDESFAERENLVRAEPPEFRPATFGPKGQVYDGWETRRRRSPGVDWAVVRLGCPGVVHGVVVDTSFFTGNYPPEVSLDAAWLDNEPEAARLRDVAWEPLVARSPVAGDARTPFAAARLRRWTHVRLSIHPDGGVARLRVHGEPLPDPGLLEALGTVDLAAAEHGGVVLGCSDRFYSRPENVLLPGPARSMGEGWETARRRDDGNDWVEVGLGVPGHVRVAEVDTSWFLHNAPGEVALTAVDAVGGRHTLVARTAVRPDTRHRFVLPPGGPELVGARLDIYPDGGLSRLRLWGRPSDAGLSGLRARWHATAPERTTR